MSFSNLTNSVYKGIKQGFDIWRTNVKREKVQELNYRYDELVDGIEILDEKKMKIKNRIMSLEYENRQLKQKCKWGE
jgi:hypothetical protein